MNDKWWKYPLAVIAFILTIFVVFFVSNILLILTNYIIPKSFQNSEEWINILSTIISILASLEIVNKIVPNSKNFQIVLSVICSVYCVGVGVWNYALGTTNLTNMIAMICGGIAAIYNLIEIVKIK